MGMFEGGLVGYTESGYLDTRHKLRTDIACASITSKYSLQVLYI